MQYSVSSSEILQGAITLVENGFHGGMDAIMRSAIHREANLEEANAAVDYFTACNTPGSGTLDALYEARCKAGEEGH